MGAERACRALHLAAAALLLTGSAAGGVVASIQSTTVEEVRVRAWNPWPAGLHKGYQPIFVELINESDRERRVDLQLRDSQPERWVRRGLRLGPRIRARVELIEPVHALGGSSSFLRVTLDGGERTHVSGLGSGDWPDPRSHPIVVLCPSRPEPGSAERWTAELSTQVLGTSRGVLTSHGRTRPAAKTTPAEETAEEPNDDIPLAAVLFDEMPRRSEPWSSLDLVVIDTRSGLPEPERMAPLLEWVRTGGALALFGPRAAELAQAQPELAPWLEERFRGKARFGAAAPYACGLGTLFVSGSDGLFATPEQVATVRYAVKAARGFVPDPAGYELGELKLSIPGLAAIPYRAFTLLLIAFAILIGPVNFILVKKSGRPVLLLLTIPALALVTSLLLFGYAVFWQGLDVKTASHSYTVLDQRARRSATAEARMIYAGMAPGEGLRPAAGTVCHAAIPKPEGFRRQPEFVLHVELGEETLLSADYLPSRKAVNQVLLSDRAARARLEVEAAGEKLAVTNGLGARIDELLLRDREGGCHRLAAPLEPGARAELEPVPATQAIAQARLMWALNPVGGQFELLPASYVAHLAQAAFTDDCGIDTNELAGRHRVLGVLDLAEEAWR